MLTFLLPTGTIAGGLMGLWLAAIFPRLTVVIRQVFFPPADQIRWGKGYYTKEPYDGGNNDN